MEAAVTCSFEGGGAAFGQRRISYIRAPAVEGSEPERSTCCGGLLQASRDRQADPVVGPAIVSGGAAPPTGGRLVPPVLQMQWDGRVNDVKELASRYSPRGRP